MEYKYDRSRYFEMPKFFYFEAGNSTVGSLNTFNYRIDPKDGRFFVKIWYGLDCSELSESLADMDFELTFEGYKAMIYHIDEKYDEYLEKLKNGEVKPRRTYVERD